jgi:hypothetical protein
MAVVSVVNSGYARDTAMMHLLRCLFFMVAHFHIQVKATHLAGVSNVAADTLSRNDLSCFFAGSSGGGQSSDSNPSRSGRPAGSGTARLDFTTLGPVVPQLFQAGLAASTQRVYNSGKKKYLEFCAKFGVPPVPVSERELVGFVASMVRQGLKHPTIKSYLSAVRHLQI